MDLPSCGGNDDKAISGENSAQVAPWRQQEVIDSSGLPSDACLLAYLQAQGTGMMKANSNQVSSGDFTDPNLPNTSSTHKLYSDSMGQHQHAFDQQQVYGKPAILGLQPQLEESHSNNAMNHQGSKRQLDTYLQTHSSAGFQSSNHWESGDGGQGLAPSSSLNQYKMMFEATLPTMSWQYGETDFGAASSGGGNLLGRASLNSFQQYPHSNVLMAMKHNGLGPAETRAEPLVGHLASLPGRAQVSTTTGSSPSHILTPADRKEDEQTSITTSQRTTSKIDGSCFEMTHETNASAGPFEPRWVSATTRPEDFQRQPDLTLAGTTTRLSNLQGILFSSYQSDNASVATAPLMLPVDNGAPSSSPPNLLESLPQSIIPTAGNFAGGSLLPPRHMLRNEAFAVDLVHHLQMQQNARMQEQLLVPRGIPLTVNSPPVPENSELAHLQEHYKQFDAETNLKGSASTMRRATSTTGIGAWSEASAELLDDLETSTREKSSRFKKKTTNKPKRPLSAYNIFFKEERERILQEIPDDAAAAAASTASAPSSSSQGSIINSRIRKGKRAPHGKIDFQSLAKAVGKRWQNLSPEGLEEYKEKANNDLARYKREMEEFTKTARVAFEEECSDLQRRGDM